MAIFKKNEMDFYKKQCVLLCLGAVLLWLVFDYTNIDIFVSTVFFDAKTSSWPYYNTFLTGKLGYLWIKSLLVLYGVLLSILLACSFKSNSFKVQRKWIVFLLLSMIIVPAEISMLKHTFYKPRPEQVFEFGGNMPHVKLGEFLWNQPSASNWPGGHASGGAALVSLYFAGRQISDNWGKTGLFCGILLSQLMGFVQVARGQHFLSHNLWTLWFAWFTVVSLHFFMFDYISSQKLSPHLLKD